MKHIKHIFFDLDHTLWDFDKNSELTFKLIFDKNNISLNFEKFIAGYEVINLNYWKLYRNNQISKEDLLFNRLKEAFSHVNFEPAADVIHKVADDYITYLSTKTHLFDGTVEVLKELQVKYKLHIITNGFTEGQTKKMKNSGLSPYFITVTDAEMVGAKKPAPKIFDFALNVAGANKNESLMIGDSYEADILGAVNYGLEAIFFNPKNQDNPEQITEVNHLLQLKKYL